MARHIVEKGKWIIIDTYLTKGPIDFNSLSSIQELKLAQAKAGEDLLKYHSEGKELLSMVINHLEKIFPSFK